MAQGHLDDEFQELVGTLLNCLVCTSLHLADPNSSPKTLGAIRSCPGKGDSFYWQRQKLGCRPAKQILLPITAGGVEP